MNWIRQAWYLLSTLSLFIRVSYLSFPIILPLLGAATVSFHLSNYQMLGLVGVAVAFHIFAHVQNDVIDLPLDRTEPLRADSPLVRGVIHPRQALAIALLHIPLGLVFTYWLGADSLAYLIFTIAAILITIYNVWGKRIIFPPLTDVIQGLGWSAMVWYGTVVVSGHPTVLSGVIIAFVTAFVVMINGVHNNLRDLANDLHCGMHTTALLLGVRPLDKGLVLSFRFKLYALTLQVLLTGIIMLPLIDNWFGYPPMIWRVMLSVVSTFMLLCWVLLILSAATVHEHLRMISIGSLHLLTLLSSILLLFAAYVGLRSITVLLIAYVLPMYSIIWYWVTRGMEKLRSTSIARQ
jgi:4-hydroxybenzoate polyprenyltransferase